MIQVLNFKLFNKKIFYVIAILILLFLPVAKSFADNATPLSTNVSFQDIADSSFVSWSVTLVSANGNYTCPFVCPGYSRINFTNIASTVNTNPTQTFGTQIQIANITITNIDSNNVYFTISPKNSSNPNLFYYFLTNVPPQVTVNSSSVPQTNYLLNPVLYPTCKTNCVLQTSTYLEIKAVPTTSNNVIVCVALPCLTIEPSGTTDALLFLIALLIGWILVFVGIKYRNPFPALMGSMVNVIAFYGINTGGNTLVYGTNQFSIPAWFNEILAIFTVVSFVVTLYIIFKYKYG